MLLQTATEEKLKTIDKGIYFYKFCKLYVFSSTEQPPRKSSPLLQDLFQK